MRHSCTITRRRADVVTSCRRRRQSFIIRNIHRPSEPDRAREGLPDSAPICLPRRHRLMASLLLLLLLLLAGDNDR